MSGQLGARGEWVDESWVGMDGEREDQVYESWVGEDGTWHERIDGRRVGGCDIKYRPICNDFYFY